MASVTEIKKFLAKAKFLISNDKYDFVPRRKNMMALATLGLTISNVKIEILNLTVENYYKGPKADFDSNSPGDIWEFKKIMDGLLFYVKLKIVIQNGDEILKCLSFHEDEFV